MRLLLVVEVLIGKIARPSKKRYSLSLLLAPSEIPGQGWRQIGEVSWRPGSLSRFRRRDPAVHKRKKGSCSALRRYRQAEPPRGMFIQVYPCASQADAKDGVRAGISNSGLSWPGVERLDQREFTDTEVSEMDVHRAFEHRNSNDGVIGYQRFILGAVENILICVSGSAADPGWPWDDLMMMAAAQANKIRTV
jgi:hypothetical protein